MSMNYGHCSLNRISRITEEQASEFAKHSKEMISVSKKYGLLIDVRMGNNGDYAYCVIHNEKPIVMSLQDEDILDIPEIKNNEGFYDKVDKFIHEISLFYPDFKKYSFSSPGKRMFLSA